MSGSPISAETIGSAMPRQGEIGLKDSPEPSETVIVTNAEGQFSIWPTDLPIPLGWSSTGFAGAREECLAQIASLWMDMMPASLRTS